jgi:hypothetical protein
MTESRMDEVISIRLTDEGRAYIAALAHDARSTESQVVRVMLGLAAEQVGRDVIIKALEGE